MCLLVRLLVYLFVWLFVSYAKSSVNTSMVMILALDKWRIWWAKYITIAAATCKTIGASRLYRKSFLLTAKKWLRAAAQTRTRKRSNKSQIKDINFELSLWRMGGTWWISLKNMAKTSKIRSFAYTNSIQHTFKITYFLRSFQTKLLFFCGEFASIHSI